MRRLIRVRVLRLVLVGAFWAASAPALMLIRGYDSSLHDRFGPGGSDFIGAGLDWTGVGKDADGRWATMVSATHFLSAAHNAPSGTLNFYAGVWHQYAIAGGTRIGSTDLWLGWLETAPGFSDVRDDNIRTYPVAFYPSVSEYLNRITFNYGQTHRIGRNVIDDVAVYTVGGSTTNSMVYDYDDADTPDVGVDETFLEGGDSGGPSFVVVDGLLTLVGIHSFHAYDSISGDPALSGDSFVPAYIDELNAAMLRAETLMWVPEPCMCQLWILAGLAAALSGRGFCRRRPCA